MRNVIEAFPYKIHTVLTDNGITFADLPKNRSGPTARFSLHVFDRVCQEHGIDHRLTKPYHPWTNGQAERMNRTIKDATVNVFHYSDLESLKAHVLAFVKAYNFAKHLKAITWKTPFEAICEAWTKDPSPFKSILATSSRDQTPRPETPYVFVAYCAEIEAIAVSDVEPERGRAVLRPPSLPVLNAFPVGTAEATTETFRIGTETISSIKSLVLVIPTQSWEPLIGRA